MSRALMAHRDVSISLSLCFACSQLAGMSRFHHSGLNIRKFRTYGALSKNLVISSRVVSLSISRARTRAMNIATASESRASDRAIFNVRISVSVVIGFRRFVNDRWFIDKRNPKMKRRYSHNGTLETFRSCSCFVLLALLRMRSKASSLFQHVPAESLMSKATRIESVYSSIIASSDANERYLRRYFKNGTAVNLINLLSIYRGIMFISKRHIFPWKAYIMLCVSLVNLHRSRNKSDYANNR